MIIPEKPREPELKDLGIYLYRNGEIEVIVDTNTLMPNTNVKFGFFGPPFLIGKDVIFWGESALPEGVYPKNHISDRQSTHQPRMEGIYRWHEGRLEVIADLTTTLRNPDEQISQFIESPFADQDAIYWGAWIQKDDRVMLKCWRLADSLTEISHIWIGASRRIDTYGGIGFGRFAYTIAIAGSKIFHHGLDWHLQRTQLHLSLPQEPEESELIANNLTPVPNGFGSFQDFLELAVDQETLAFVALS